MFGIYLHIPFCNKICAYCDFYKMKVSDSYKKRYTDYLIKEIVLRKDLIKNKQITSIYIGGGTPSSLCLEELERIFIAIKDNFDLTKIVEYTIEANIEDINDDFIKLIKRFNLNRISIGVETFNFRLGSFLNRITQFETLKNVVELLRKNEFLNYNFDLIYAIPRQTLDELQDDIQQAMSLEPAHLSFYSLILEDHTILMHQYQKHLFEEISPELDRKMYQVIKETLVKNGYRQYEISNFCKDDQKSIHNLLYWNYEEYLGIGPSSSSFIDHRRFSVINNINMYYKSLDDNKILIEEEKLSNDDFINDFVMVSLRKTSGFSLQEFKNLFGCSFFEHYKQADKLINDGLLTRLDDFIFINEEYLYIQNFILNKLF